MQRPGRQREMFVAVFFLGCVLFTPPVLTLSNKANFIAGIPSLYLFLFVAWGAVILLTALIAERTKACALPPPGDRDRLLEDTRDEGGDA
jgi:hypothetical protein